MSTDVVAGEAEPVGEEIPDGEPQEAREIPEDPHDRRVRVAKEIGEALQEASAKVPIRQIKYEMWARGKEWIQASEDLDDLGDLGMIDLLCSVTPGMMVPSFSPADDPWVGIIRIMTNGGQWTLHVRVIQDGGFPKDDYRNMLGPTSPVVTRR